MHRLLARKYIDIKARVMTYRLFFAIGLLCLSNPAYPNSTEHMFDAAFAKHIEAVQKRDLVALEKTLTRGDQLTLILPSGVITNTKQAFLDFHKTFFAEQGWTIRFDPVSKLVGKEFAVVTTKSLYQDTVDGKPYQSRSWVTFTFQKQKNQWRLIHDQNTRAPADQQ